MLSAEAKLVENFSKIRIAIILVIIGIISLSLKLYTVDFSIPVQHDNLGYTLDAILYSQGDFFINPKSNPGWRLFISPFMLLTNSSDFIDYSNIVRILSITISTITILPMYILARKFFSEKYSIAASALFAFEPHLNYNSSFGLSEPLFIIILVISLSMILNKNIKYAYLSFVLAGFFWWIKFEGIILFVAFSIIYFLNFRKSSRKIPKYILCVLIFLIIIFPNFLQREQQFGDPFFFWYEETLFSKDYATLLSQPEGGSVEDFLEEEGLETFIDRFILTGFFNIFSILPRILFPYLIILLPFGIIFSFRAFDQNRKYIQANWIVILATIGILVIPMAIIPERRFLFQLYPLFIIFAIIPIQRVIEYGLSTFEFSEKQKNNFLILVIIIIIILSSLFTITRFGPVDTLYENEQIKYARFLQENFSGKILDGGNSIEYLFYSNQVNSEGKLDVNKIARHDKRDPYNIIYADSNIARVRISGTSLEELIINGEPEGLTHIAINGDGPFFFPFLEDVFNNEEKYFYLKKVFDSELKGYEKLKIKVFQIDHVKFKEI